MRIYQNEDVQSTDMLYDVATDVSEENQLTV